MTFSIVTVNYNGGEGLVRTATSTLKQTFGDFEWIVIDGGSTDGSKNFLETIDDGRLKWSSEPDLGIFDGMNKGIREATREYCVFMNSGDVFASDNVLKDIDDAIGNIPADIVYGDSFEFAQDRMLLKRARRPIFNFYSMFTHHQSIFYRREMILGGYDLDYKYSADWALTTNLLSKRSVSKLYVPVPVCIFERGGVSQRQDQRAAINKEHWRILTREAGVNVLAAAILWYSKTRANEFRRLAPNLYDKLRFIK